MKKNIQTKLLVLAAFACLGLASCNSSSSKSKKKSRSTTSSTSQSSTTSSSSAIPVTGISLDIHELPLSFNAEYTIRATISPSNATNQEITWESSNTSVATVKNGKIMSSNVAGQATITVTTDDGWFTDSCIVTVSDTDIAVTGVDIPYDYVTLELGKSVTLSKNIQPSNAANQNVAWSSSDESVATINSSGTISTVSAGTSTITVETEDGGFTDTCLLTVEQNDDPSEEYVPDPSDPDIQIVNQSVLDGMTPTSKGEYEFTLDDESTIKQFYVNAEDAKIILNLSGATITNSKNSPIYIADCDSIEISAKNGTTNQISDTRSVYSEDETGQGKGAIFVANGDLKFKGKGALTISAGYYNGVHGKDDVEMKNLSLNITAIHHGIKANDRFVMESGALNIECGGDGIHTDNSDISSKLKQRGDITISSGTVTINSWCDAIQAAHDVYVSGDAILTLNTNKYSSYEGTVLPPNETSLYLKMNSTTYASGGYTYAAYIDGAWYKAAYKGTSNSGGGGGFFAPGGGGPGGGGGGGSTYYIYEIEKPASATNFTLYRFAGSNVTEFSTVNYNAKSESKAFNSNYDMLTVSVSGSTISASSWSTYTKNNTNVADVSAKAIKCENEIYISGGEITAKTYDDGIHANNDGLLENGETPLGNVHISGGVINVDASDDGIHADYILDISGGEINVTNAYEGLEGNVINISGGTSYVKATDDGVNASSGPQITPAINISGGYLDVEVSSRGDTDGIDSNGTITITAGTVIVKGPGSASSGAHGPAAVDCDRGIKISGGTLVVFGGVENLSSYSGTTRTLCSSSTVSKGDHTVSFQSGATVYLTTLNYSTSGCVVYSSLGTATLK